MKQPFLFLIILLFAGAMFAQTIDTIKYKSLPDGDLYLEVLYPKGADVADTLRPAAMAMRE